MYTNGHGTMLTDIVAGTTLMYIIVGAFFYIPGLIMINLINWIAHLAKRV